MKKALYILFIFTFILSCSKLDSDIRELEIIRNKKFSEADIYLQKNKWVISDIKEKNPNASIADVYDYLETDIKTTKIGIGEVNEVSFVKNEFKNNFKDTLTKFLTIRQLKFNKMGTSYKEGFFNYHTNIVRLMTSDINFDNQLNNKNYVLIENELSKNKIEKIYKKDSMIYYYTKYINPDSKISSELIIMNDSIYALAKNRFKKQQEILNFLNN